VECPVVTYPILYVGKTVPPITRVALSYNLFFVFFFFFYSLQFYKPPQFEFGDVFYEIGPIVKHFSGMVEPVVIAWVLWFIYVILLETAAPKVIYEPMENITMISMMAIPITGHILTFLAIRTNN